MKSRFTPALCEYLEGLGLSVDFHQSIQLDGKITLELSIKNLDPEDADDYQKEMEENSKTVCTNG